MKVNNDIRIARKLETERHNLAIEDAILKCISQANALPVGVSDEYYKGYKDAIAECIKAIRLLKV